MFTRIITKIRFDIYGTEYIKSVIRWLEFVFGDFFPQKIKLLLCHRSKLKNWMPLQCLKKKFQTKQKNRKDYFQIYKKMKKVLCFSIVLIKSYTVTNLVLNKKQSEVTIFRFFWINHVNHFCKRTRARSHLNLSVLVPGINVLIYQFIMLPQLIDWS